jgi:cytochrome c biogenesis protein CcdA/thiol-disulfide isomerase/thioredoxin
MILLIAFAFLAGIVTILSPCILPILPIILSSTIGGQNVGRARPVGVVIGFILSFTFFTLFLSTIVKISGISADFLRVLSVVVIAGFGISLLLPQFQVLVERLFSRFASIIPQTTPKPGLSGGLVVGLSLGLLWTPCVGPILASVISLALTGTVTLDAFLITLAYASGTALPMFLILLGGQNALKRVPWLLANSGKIQKVFGVIMIATALGILTNVDRAFQTWVLQTFPQYGTGLTKLEDNNFIRQQLQRLGNEDTSQNQGKPMYEVNQTQGPLAPELKPGGVWFNSNPLTLKELRGKVVLIDFWTYSCINCQRTLPYLTSWWEKYHDKGLVIIGVHSPEFEFEKEEKNVKKAIEDFQIKYPVMQDNDFATWRAYDNLYWPAKYFIDKNGVIRHTHFGEGEYDESEKIIQDLLKETGAKNVTDEINNPTYTIASGTPETYLGYARLKNFASPEPIQFDTFANYSKPADLLDNDVAYEGKWLISDEYANPQKGSKLHLNFAAKEVFLVMRPTGQPAKMKVLVDGKPQYFGEDNKNGVVTITSDSLYKLIKLETPGRHILQIEFEDNNAQLYAFTFG